MRVVFHRFTGNHNVYGTSRTTVILDVTDDVDIWSGI